MSLTAKDVDEITRLLDESNFDELYLEIDGIKLSLKRGSAADRQLSADRTPVPAAAAAPAPTIPAVRAPERPAATDPNSIDVTAPLLGTFYRAPKPGAAPYVELGSEVEQDSIVGIIEVMKLMSTVRAGVRGAVVQILGRDGVLVEYGETLMRVSQTV